MENKSKFSSFMEKYCDEKHKIRRNLVNLLFVVLSIVGVLLLLSMPICVITGLDEPIKVIAGNAFKALASDNAYELAYSKIQLVSLIIIILCLSVHFVILLKSLLSLQNENKGQKLAHKSVFLGVLFVAIYTLFTWVFSPINVSKGGHSISSVSYGPIIYIVMICLLYAIYNGILNIYSQ